MREDPIAGLRHANRRPQRAANPASPGHLFALGMAGKWLLGPLRGVCGSQATPCHRHGAGRSTGTGMMRSSPSRVGNGRDRPRPTRAGDAERTLSGPPPQAMRPGRKTTSRNNAARTRRHGPGQVIGLPREPAGRLHVPVHDVGRRGSRVEASQVNSRRSSCPSSPWRAFGYGALPRRLCAHPPVHRQPVEAPPVPGPIGLGQEAGERV